MPSTSHSGSQKPGKRLRINSVLATRLLLRLSDQRGTLRQVADVREAAANDYYLLGQGDIFFTPVGGEAYLKDLPKAQMHRRPARRSCLELYLPPPKFQTREVGRHLNRTMSTRPRRRRAYLRPCSHSCGGSSLRRRKNPCHLSLARGRLR
jgi:hypothetical protein